MASAHPSSQNPTPRIRVLVVDDSPLMRRLLSRELGRDTEIEIVGVASDAYAARDQIFALRPDVLTLDIQMPRMDGITFLRRLMKYHPIPVIIVSSLAAGGGAAAIEAMAAGAVDVIPKPAPSANIAELSALLAEKVKAAHKVRLCAATSSTAPAIAKPALSSALSNSPDGIFALGASTGGVQALTQIITAFPSDSPATLIVQHMPPGFTASFAQRLNSISNVQVKEASDGDSVIPGRVLIAPGDYHMVLRRATSRYYVEVKQGPQVCHQCPSIQVLFNSIVGCATPNVVAALLTGMGSDGAEGLSNLRKAGAATIAQDEQSCAVFGMPAEAIRRGAAEKVVPLDQIASTMFAMFRRQKSQLSAHGA